MRRIRKMTMRERLSSEVMSLRSKIHRKQLEIRQLREQFKLLQQTQSLFKR